MGNTRILLELVIYAFRQGETPEGIIDSYPSLTLADVYAVIAYYLNHREEVDSYIRQSEAKGKQLQAQIEAKRTPETEAVRARMRSILQAER
ncbi:MAG: DUF433 domain-containing protein [Anaerolineae bacterium]|nr:DUF433 domain-containing protein [Anaerolineae bacterium]